ncbi:hypothetical protein V8B55DRAFT_1505356 [Mucor lusitanicus]|uniref:Required for respiratory growth protein 9, mitochondrial n=2 Tax=Mucor circinelloides f. lusitanicus TaxID=29924 RepID=A0A162U1G9_MUCCL|nr:hypothetical protein FB192DRAFT_1341064 [Mucor lusitanicus]OAD08742.1 hypothetical protein MUCCIDRAFT_105709 [Mucor lusitanicus CBS 277.49]
MFRSIFRLKPANARLFSSDISESAGAASNWAPKKRVSRPTMEKIRALAATQPEVYNVVTLSREFKLSVEGIRRILKSKYVPEAKDGERQEKNRYEAMGERRKEFKKTYNIPEGNPKEFWNSKTTDKVQDISMKRQEKSTSNNKWSNDVYNKRRSFDDDTEHLAYRRSTGFNRENEQQGRGAYNDDRQRSHSKERAPFRQYYNDQDRRSFNKNSNASNGERGSFRRDHDNEDRRPFKRDFNYEDTRSDNRGNYSNERRQPFGKENGVERPTFDRRFDRSDGDRRSFRRDNDAREGSYGERKPFRRGNDHGSYNRDDSYGERKPFRRGNDHGSYNRDDSYGERKPFRGGNSAERRPNRFNDEKPFRNHINHQDKRSFNRQTSRDVNHNNAAGDRGFKSD